MCSECCDDEMREGREGERREGEKREWEGGERGGEGKDGRIPVNRDQSLNLPIPC